MKTLKTLRPSLSQKELAKTTHCFQCNTPLSGKTSRYCEYFGENFCTECHHNQESIVPARIIHQWDFGRYKVSEVARDILRKSLSVPEIQVPDTLYVASRRMARAKELR